MHQERKVRNKNWEEGSAPLPSQPDQPREDRHLYLDQGTMKPISVPIPFFGSYHTLFVGIQLA